MYVMRDMYDVERDVVYNQSQANALYYALKGYISVPLTLSELATLDEKTIFIAPLLPQFKRITYVFRFIHQSFLHDRKNLEIIIVDNI